LVLILKEFHEKLDALVSEAYGWSATLNDEQILANVVALNKERRLEEMVGDVRWLRPKYQIPRFSSEGERARLKAERDKRRQEMLALDDEEEDLDDDDEKPKFPTGNELAETADVMHVLATAVQAMTIEQITKRFSQGKAVEKRVTLTVLALARLGHLSTTQDGRSFVLRRADNAGR
jgi:hypothetical protein